MDGKRQGKIKKVDSAGGKSVVILFDDGEMMVGSGGLGVHPDSIKPDEEYLVVKGDYDRVHIFETPFIPNTVHRDPLTNK